MRSHEKHLGVGEILHDCIYYLLLSSENSDNSDGLHELATLPKIVQKAIHLFLTAMNLAWIDISTGGDHINSLQS